MDSTFGNQLSSETAGAFLEASSRVKCLPEGLRQQLVRCSGGGEVHQGEAGASKAIATYMKEID